MREQNNIFVIKILAEKNSFGALSKYANKNLIPLESTAWQNSAVEKYIKNFLDSADVNFQDIEIKNVCSYKKYGIISVL